MKTLSNEIKDTLLAKGADLIGFADLSDLSEEKTLGFPRGICLALAYPKEVIRGISELPTKEYYEHYNELNKRLDALVVFGAELLIGKGFRAYAQTVADMKWDEETYSTRLPHKTVATKARIGWIGKSALLVTEKFGSAIRISTILTDAPLKCEKPITGSKCGGCKRCSHECPGNAIKGVRWSSGIAREELFEPEKCAAEAKKRTRQSLGFETTICGKCIEACPYTQRYINNYDGENYAD